jgi:hypothetical protein
MPERSSSLIRFIKVAALAACYCMGETSYSYADEQEELSLHAFIDTTIAHDFNHLPTRYRPYTTQPYYSDEGSLNLGYVDAILNTDRYRGRIATQYGSSVVANYADEPHEFFRYIQEAYGGVKITDAWTVDAGIFSSHIGMESWISRDNYTVSRSIMADYSPYYQSGIRTGYDFSNELRLELHLIRGWQNISDDREPAFGSSLAYSPAKSTKLTHNICIANEHGKRVFNDFIVRHQLSEDFGISAAYDLGAQEREDDSRAWWHGWAIIPHYKISDTLAVAGRVERYVDPHQVMITTLSDRGFDTTGLSANIDTVVAKGLLWRNEYRAFISTKDIYPRREGYSASDSFVMSSLIYSLG